MSEIAYRTKEHAGVNRRTRGWGGARPLQAPAAPVPAGRIPAMQVSATAPAAATQASAVFNSGIRPVPSTSHPHGTAHLRPAVKVPVRLSLAGLGAATGSVSVHMNVSPVTPVTGDVSMSFSYVDLATVSLPLTLKRAGNTFTAAFTCVVAAGSAQLDFDFGGHSYRGRNTDRGDFLMTTEVTFQEHGKQAPTVLATSALIHL
ncbi:hypothetical protein [Arthrobacter sp. LjRoot14]|uniref:hypothetical protein n=1 Tax=Arthrobacter sp. LjRoot14 TaxID=3342265 RepID=UPI003ED16CA6